MRKLCGLLAVVLSICSCAKLQERKAQSLVKDHLEKTMNDWKSYESVEFGTLDSTFVLYTETWQGVEDKGRVNSLQEKSKKFETRAMDAFSRSEQLRLLDSCIHYLEAAKTVQTYLIEKMKSYKGDFNGWKMTHKYRGNNSYGGKILVTTVFYFDKDLNRITSLDDLKN